MSVISDFSLLKLKSKKVFKASTIIESIVAMTIIMIGFGIALLIFLNINKSDNAFQKFKAQIILGEFAANVKKEINPLSDQEQVGDIMIIQTILDYPGYMGVKQLNLEAYDRQGKKIAMRKELIITKTNE